MVQTRGEPLLHLLRQPLRSPATSVLRGLMRLSGLVVMRSNRTSAHQDATAADGLMQGARTLGIWRKGFSCLKQENTRASTWQRPLQRIKRSETL